MLLHQHNYYAHTFVDGPFMVALAQSVYVAQESDGEVSVCVTALSSTAMLNANVAVIVRTESGTATESGTVCIMSLINNIVPRPIPSTPFPAFQRLSCTLVRGRVLVSMCNKIAS